MADDGMIAISERCVIDAAPDDVWRVIRQPAVVAECLPGASLTESGADGQHRGAIRVKFGPTVVSFRGEAKVDYDDANRVCTIESRGSDQRNTSRARARGIVALSEKDGSTEIAIEGGFQISGALGSFARTGGVHLARELIVDFAKNMSQRLAANDAPLESEVRRETSIGGGTLLMRVLAAWFRDLLGRSGGKA